MKWKIKCPHTKTVFCCSNFVFSSVKWFLVSSSSFFMDTNSDLNRSHSSSVDFNRAFKKSEEISIPKYHYRLFKKGQKKDAKRTILNFSNRISDKQRLLSKKVWETYKKRRNTLTNIFSSSFFSAIWDNVTISSFIWAHMSSEDLSWSYKMKQKWQVM